MKLTIAIPTYNRYEILERTLKIIIPQLREGVELVVLDNASPRAVENLVLNLAKINDVERYVRPMRNPYNIGANANVMRCFEMATGDWVWVLGDDDEPAINAVEMALEYINEMAAVICFSAKVTKSDLRGDGLSYIGVVDFGEALFISGNIFNRRLLMTHLRHGYDYIYSCAPHLALAIMALSEGASYIIVGKDLVRGGDPGPNGRWNPVKVGAHLIALLELPCLDEFHRRLLWKIMNKYYGFNFKRWTLWMAQLSIQQDDEKKWYYAEDLIGRWGAFRNSSLDKFLARVVLRVFRSKISPLAIKMIKLYSPNSIHQFGVLEAAL